MVPPAASAAPAEATSGGAPSSAIPPPAAHQAAAVAEPRKGCPDGTPRRRLSLEVRKVEVRLYRRIRTSADVTPVPPHFVYHVRCRWSGDPSPCDPPALFRAAPCASPTASPRSPRARSPPPASGRNLGSAGQHAAAQEPWAGASDEDWLSEEPWWDRLPSSYVVKRRWADLVRLHNALSSDLAFDSSTSCWRVKERVPKLPNPADLDAWLKGYAAIGDAWVLGRRQPLIHLDSAQERSLEALHDLHWIYVENRLAPYFAAVNRVLLELPPDVLVRSKVVRQFVTCGGVAGRAPTTSATLPPPRFLGPLTPLMPDRDDLHAAATKLRRSGSAPTLPPSSPGGVGRAKTGLPKL